MRTESQLRKIRIRQKINLRYKVVRAEILKTKRFPFRLNDIFVGSVRSVVGVSEVILRQQ